MIKEFLETIALYAGAMLTILTATATLFKMSGSFKRWAATSIVRNADMTELNGCIGGCKFEKSIQQILDKLKELDNIKMITKRLEYLNVRHHNEDDEITINAIYDEYKRLGGNSYIDMDYEKWSNRKTGGNEGKKNKKQHN